MTTLVTHDWEPTDLYLGGRSGEWDATVFVLGFLNHKQPGGLRNDELLGWCHPEKYRIDWDAIVGTARVWSSREQRLLDVAASLWSGNVRAWGFDSDNPYRPLAPLSKVWGGLSDEWFEVVIEAMRIRRRAGR